MANHRAPHTGRSTRTATTLTRATFASALIALPMLAALPATAASGDAATTGVLEKTNAERAEAGCGELTRDSRIDEAAQGYAEKMSDSGRLSHTGTDGSKFIDRMKAAGYAEPGGENIARGQNSSSEVMDDWMNSSGHRRNILDCSFRTIGIGHTEDGFWVQNFGR